MQTLLCQPLKGTHRHLSSNAYLFPLLPLAFDRYFIYISSSSYEFVSDEARAKFVDGTIIAPLGARIFREIAASQSLRAYLTSTILMGTMMRTRAPLVERANDLYEIPPVAVRALPKAEALTHRIGEPAGGPGAIAHELLAAWHNVLPISSTISRRINGRCRCCPVLILHFEDFHPRICWKWS